MSPVEVIPSTGPFERIALPDGTEVFYNAERHTYWKGVKEKGDSWAGVGRLLGVSTSVKPFDWDPGALMGWAAKMDREGVAALAAEGLSLDEPDDMRAALRWLSSPEAISDALTDARLSYRHARDDAAARGTNVHLHALHALASGAPVPDLDSLTVEERGYAMGVIAYWHEHDPQVVASEQVVADLDIEVAGRVDLITDRAVVDCKTVATLPTDRSPRLPYSSQHVQVAGYRMLAAACGVADVTATEILQVFSDGTYRLVSGQASADDFYAALRVYRGAARIQRDTKAAA